MSEPVPCVVCAAPVAMAVAHFANAWEKTRKKAPCCGEACAARFHPDVHWMPAVQPAAADVDERRRLLGVVRTRLLAGDKPAPVLREALLAGVEPAPLQQIVSDYIKASRTTQDRNDRRTLGRLLFGLFTKKVPDDQLDPRDPGALTAASADLLAWQQRWPSPG